MKGSPLLEAKLLKVKMADTIIGGGSRKKAIVEATGNNKPVCRFAV